MIKELKFEELEQMDEASNDVEGLKMININYLRQA